MYWSAKLEQKPAKNRFPKTVTRRLTTRRRMERFIHPNQRRKIRNILKYILLLRSPHQNDLQEESGVLLVIWKWYVHCKMSALETVHTASYTPAYSVCVYLSLTLSLWTCLLLCRCGGRWCCRREGGWKCEQCNAFFPNWKGRYFM